MYYTKVLLRAVNTVLTSADAVMENVTFVSLPGKGDEEILRIIGIYSLLCKHWEAFGSLYIYNGLNLFPLF